MARQSKVLAVPEIGALESFETPYVQKEVAPICWSVEKYEVAQMFALQGKTKAAIARELGLPITAVNTWFRHPEFNEYIDKLVLEKATLLKAKKLRLLTKALDAREAQAELTGYGDITGKDTLDIIAEIRKETGEEKVATTGYTSLLEKMIMKTMEQPHTIIEVSSDSE